MIQEKEWDVNETLNNFQWTALHLAAFQGDCELVTYLLQHGADASRVNSSGLTPLMLAEHRGNKDISGLLSCGAAEILVPISSSSA